MDPAGLDLEAANLFFRALSRVIKERNQEEQLERALYSLKYGEIYKEEHYGDL
jgi:hypothetical protein